MPADAELPFVPLEAVWASGLDLSRRRPRADVTTGYTRFREGDIVLPKITPTFQADRTVIAKDLDGGVAAGTTELHVIRVSQRAEPRYIRYLLSSRPFLHGGEAEMIGVAGQKRVPDDWLRNLVVPILDSTKQRAIAAFLDTETARIDALIAKKQQLAALADRRWVTVLIASVDPGSDPRAPRLRRAVTSSIGGSWGSEPGTSEHDATCVRGTDFDVRRLGVKSETAPVRSFASTELAGRRLQPGDLIVEKSGGGDTQPVGRVVLWSGEGDAVPTNFAARLRPAPTVVPRYLAYVFRSAYERGMTRAWIKQTTGIQNLDLGGLLSERWQLPERAEQERVVRELDRLMDETLEMQRLLNRQIDLLCERRQALITAAVTGELAIGDSAA